jgi:tetratricopeptide (TPR) repeat protein
MARVRMARPRPALLSRCFAAACILLTPYSVPARAEEESWPDKLKRAQALHAEGRTEDSIAVLEEALRLAEQQEAPPRALAQMEQTLGALLHHAGRNDEAEAHARRAVAILATVVPPLDGQLARYRMELGLVELLNGKLDEAEYDICTALEVASGAPEHEARCLQSLAFVAMKRRAYATMVALLNRAAELLGTEATREAAVLRLAVLTTLGRALMDLGQMEQAEQVLSVAHQGCETPGLAAVADTLPTARAYAELLLRTKRFAECEQLVVETLASSRVGDRPELAELAACAAGASSERGDFEVAEVRIVQALGWAPRNAFVLEMSASLLERRRYRDEARRMLAKALAEREKDEEDTIGLARTLLRLATLDPEPAGAMHYAERSLRIYLRVLGGSHPEAREACACYARLREKALAAGVADVPPPLRGLMRGDGIEPDGGRTDEQVTALLEQAEGLGRQGKRTEALSLLDEAVRLRPGEIEAHMRRALLLISVKRREEAVEACNAAIAAPGRVDAVCFRVRAASQAALERYERAAVDASYAIALGDREALYLRGLAREGLEHWELALKSFDAGPSHLTQFRRGQVLLELGDLARAREAFQSVLETQPARARVELAWIERRLANPEAAIAEATAAIEAAPDESDGYWTRGALRMDRGEWREAGEDFAAAVRCGDDSLTTALHVWLCRARLGEREAADEALAAAAAKADEGVLRAAAQAILGAGPEPAFGAPPRGEEQGHCEARFFLGAWRALEGDMAGARVHWERAFAMSLPRVSTYWSAQAALVRLATGK